MKRTTQGTVLSVIGVIAAVAAIGGLYLNFLKPAMRWPLLVSALVLLVVAVLRAGGSPSQAPGPEAAGPPSEDTDRSHHKDDHGHDHDRAPRVGWLLLVPFALLGAVTPGPLGAFSAERDSGRIMSANASTTFDPLASTEGGSVVPLTEYSMRALYDDPANLKGTSFVLMGFASSLPDGEGWALTRMSMSCCAGDAQAVKVRVLDAPPPADNEWVEVKGVWEQASTPADDPNTLPVIRATGTTPVNAPAQTYE